MNSKKTLMSLYASMALLTVSAADAQMDTRNSGSEGWGSKSDYGRMFDPQRVETVRGEVVKVEKATPMKGMGRGVHLSVKTDSGTIPVHLGPSWFIENQEMQIKPKDRVEITGSRVSLEGKPAIIAQEIKTKGQVLRLRDEDGRPVWAAWSSQGEGPRTMGQGIMHQGMIGGMRGQGMMEQHRQMMSEWKARDAELKKKVEAMNETQGRQKMDAMAAVINELVQERERMFSHMQRMQAQIDMGHEAAGAERDSEGKDSEEKEHERHH